jgi:hypothetical protein
MILWVRFGGADQPGALVHDGSAFWPGYTLRSTRTGDGVLSTPYVFTVYRAGGWPTGTAIDFYVRAVDTLGNQGDAS